MAGSRAQWWTGAAVALAGCHGLTAEVDANNAMVPAPVRSGADPGSVTLHRLNRAEYDNSVRDLLGTKLTPAADFPADPTAFGFDNNADALTMSGAMLEALQYAAEQLADEVSADPNGRLNDLAPCPAGTDPAGCLSAFVGRFGRRTWRRPLTSSEVAQVADAAKAQAGTDYPQQVAYGVAVLLTSPYFLFRVELDPDPTSTTAHPLSPYELATRMSYFIWSSTPDDALLAAAAAGDLASDEGLGRELARLLADPRATSGLTNNFVGQWLELRNTAAYEPDSKAFPAFKQSLRDAMIAQTDRVFADLLAGTASFADLFTSDATYLNDELAALYGLPAPGSQAMTRVTVPAGPRRGLLGQGAVLAATSFPNRTSLVHRGRYVANQLLCAPVPDAPPNVAPLPPASSSGSQRQRLEAHVSGGPCASCHKAMDPYGYVLEQFDAIGALRTTDNGVAIDTSATLPGGEQVQSIEELDQLLAHDVRVQNCFVQQLTTYALGRGPSENDQAAIHALQSGFIAGGQRVDQLIANIVRSPAFRQRRGGE